MQFLISILTFVLGLLTKVIYDRIPFFSKKSLIKEIRNDCPQIFLSKTCKGEKPKVPFKRSIFYEVKIRINLDTEKRDCCSVSYKNANYEDINFDEKYLITINNLSKKPSVIMYFIFDKYGSISTNNFEHSFLINNNQITLIFSLMEKPDKILISFENSILTYDITEILEGVIQPKVKINKKLK